MKAGLGKYRIAFFDIDGTLLDLGKKEPSPRTVEALARLKENGVLLCIATGRSPLVVPRFSGIDFDVFITFNGSYCYDQASELFSNPVPAGDVRKIIENAAAISRPVCIATKDRLAANGTDRDLEDYFRIAGLEVNIDPDFSALPSQDIFQIMAGARETEYEALMKEVSGARITAWWDRAVDIIPACGGKGLAVRKVLEAYGISTEQSIAFGDGNNDIEMLESAGTGVAMANGSARLKAVADDVCASVSDDGIYHYCLEKGLI